jgi:hypothetical protein
MESDRERNVPLAPPLLSDIAGGMAHIDEENSGHG